MPRLEVNPAELAQQQQTVLAGVCVDVNERAAWRSWSNRSRAASAKQKTPYCGFYADRPHQ
jgi:hypothetical protein